MSAYYNEIDPYAAQWLRNLMGAGLIAPGDVDERSIIDVRPDDLRGYRQCHFFAGIGGWSYAARLAGWPDDRELWTGSCPCQPFSLAGKQKGFDDARHLWPVWKHIIAERNPPVVFGEQVASATEWLGLVRSDLEEMGYAVGAMPVQAASAGADHLRDRYWFVADAEGERGNGSQDSSGADGWSFAQGAGVIVADANDAGPQGREVLPERAGQRIAGPNGLADANSNPQGPQRGNAGKVRGFSKEKRQPEYGSALSGGSGDELDWTIGADGKARRVKPGIRLLADGVPNRVAKLRAFGNAIDPRPASQFIAAYLDQARAAA